MYLAIKKADKSYLHACTCSSAFREISTDSLEAQHPVNMMVCRVVCKNIVTNHACIMMLKPIKQNPFPNKQERPYRETWLERMSRGN